MATGFEIKTGLDLNTVFAPYVSGPQAVVTGFENALGKDLSTVFAPYVSGTKAALTGFQISDGADLNSVFAPPISFKLSTSSLIGGVCNGNCSANNGIGYCSMLNGTTYALLYKTTNYGVTWSLITPPAGGSGGVATNAANNALILFYPSLTDPTTQQSIGFKKSINGGTTWTDGMQYLSLTGGTMARNATNNPVIPNRADLFYYLFNFLDTSTSNSTLANWPSGDRASTLSGSCAMSDGPNYFATITSGLRVYRNTTQNISVVSGTINPVDITNNEIPTPNYIGTCCNATNTVNLIVNRTTTTGGKIYRTTTWNGTFTAVDNSPVELWRQVATSSAGNVVCAIADTKIYLSTDTGLTWKNITYNSALIGFEYFKFVTVSPDEKFISVATTTPRIFYCTL